MKKSLLLIATIYLGACQHTATQTGTEQATDTVVSKTELAATVSADSVAIEDDQYATYYLSIADTGSNYYTLDERMYELGKTMKLDIDTMNRLYDKVKDRIVLNENDEDEMYRGEYFPRRYPSENLSLEYLYAYSEHAATSTISLVAGIYGTKQESDSLVNILKAVAPKAFTLQAKVYIGCMH